MTNASTNHHIKALKLMTLGAYDLQMLRMQTGLRLCANFRQKLGEQDGEEATIEDGETQAPAEELSPKAEKLIDQLKQSYTRLTDGVARNRALPAEAGFIGDALISDFAELVLVDQYLQIEKRERQHFAQLGSTLEKIQVYAQFLGDVAGIGPALAAVLITYFDIEKARHVSAFWAYAGLDVAPDGRGRSRRKEHLIERPYVTKTGADAVKLSVTYNPWLKARLMGVLAPSLMRTGKSAYKKTYDDYRHRLETDPARKKVTLAEYKRAHKAGEDTSKIWTPGRIHKAAMRYMVKMFLRDLWVKWRTIEGLPVTPDYHEAKLGHRHGHAAA